jgi:hypothetical protein
MGIGLWLGIGLTALLSAGLTWLLAWALYRMRLHAETERLLAEVQTEFEARVKSGVLAAGQELLPAFREQVKLGFQDALRETQTGAMVEGYASAVNRSADLLANRIGGLFGVKPPRK